VLRAVTSSTTDSIRSASQQSAGAGPGAQASRPWHQVRIALAQQAVEEGEARAHVDHFWGVSSRAARVNSRKAADACGSNQLACSSCWWA
jgi:hypothetical protein